MYMIVIGSSTGGPKALRFVLSGLPADLEAIVVVAQHLPLRFTETLASSLDRECDIRVVHMKNGEFLTTRTVYIIPGEFHFFLTAPKYQTYLLSASTALHPSVDMAFTSVAEHFKDKTIGVVLTGMGNDGTRGAKAIKNAGGYVIAQDEETSAINGMPQSVYESGYCDERLPLEKIVDRLLELTNYGGHD